MDSIYYIESMHLAAIVGGIAFALSGYFVGTRKKLDIMGIFILAFLAANGGGVLRDVLVDRTPAILRLTEPFWLTALTLGIASLLKLQKLERVERHWLFIVCDAVGLVAFGITGALVGIEENVHFFGVLALSFLTATGGGIIRDLLVNEVPEVLHGGFYGSVAILLAAAIYALHTLAWLNPLSLLAAFGIALAVRLVAYKQNWQLPKI